MDITTQKVYDYAQRSSVNHEILETTGMQPQSDSIVSGAATETQISCRYVTTGTVSIHHRSVSATRDRRCAPEGDRAITDRQRMPVAYDGSHRRCRHSAYYWFRCGIPDVRKNIMARSS